MQMTLLSIEHVSKTHWVGAHEKLVLADVSLAMKPGDLFGVWGAQRAGKSTLLRIAAGLEPPDKGVVRFDDLDLATLPSAQRDRLRLSEIGFVQRDGPQNRSFSMLQYLTLPLLKFYSPREAQSRAIATLKRLNVADCGDARWHQLSDGEKTLVSIAHGLVRGPRLLLVDEPTSGLDTLQQAAITGLLRRVAAEEGMGVLMTSSTLAAVTVAHEAFTLSAGRLLPVTDAARPGGQVINFRHGDKQTG